MTNDLPDSLISCGCAGETRNIVTAEVTVEDIKQYMPNYWSRFVELQGGDEKAAIVDLKARFTNTVTGKVQGIPTCSLEYTLPFAVLWRADIVEDDLGMKMPTTLDEVEAIFAAFKAKYPKKFPYRRVADFLGVDFVFSAYGVATLFMPWQMLDDKLTQPQYTENYKQGIARLAKWYKLGYINPEYITATGQEADTAAFVKGDGIVTNIEGMFVGAAADLNPNGYEAQAKAINPNARVAYMAPLKPEPIAKKYAVRVYSPYPGWQQWISVNAAKDKDPERYAALLQVLDQTSSNEELYMLAQYGIKGTHYDLDAAGVPVFKAKYAGSENAAVRRAEGIGSGAFNQELSQDRFLFKVQGAKYQKAWDTYAAVMGWKADTYQKTFIQEFGPSITLPNKVAYGTKYPEATTTFDQRNNFITGKWSMDKYDAWLADYKTKSGYDEMMKLAVSQKLPFYEIALK
jgi:hypothetical protein